MPGGLGETMNEIGDIHGAARTAPCIRLVRPSPQARQGGSRVASMPPDRVEISEVATYMEKLQRMSDIRRELVDRVRVEIEAGRYETPERIDATVDILLDELGYPRLFPDAAPISSLGRRLWLMRDAVGRLVSHVKRFPKMPRHYLYEIRRRIALLPYRASHVSQ